MKNPNFRQSYGWVVPTQPPLWADVSNNLITENQDLDYFSLIPEGVHRSCPEIKDYAKYTVEKFKFEDDFKEYYGI
jgi:hypothetical protein